MNELEKKGPLRVKSDGIGRHPDRQLSGVHRTEPNARGTSLASHAETPRAAACLVSLLADSGIVVRPKFKCSKPLRWALRRLQVSGAQSSAGLSSPSIMCLNRRSASFSIKLFDNDKGFLTTVRGFARRSKSCFRHSFTAVISNTQRVLRPTRLREATGQPRFAQSSTVDVSTPKSLAVSEALADFRVRFRMFAMITPCQSPGLLL